jgi:hypothetical protein
MTQAHAGNASALFITAVAVSLAAIAALRSPRKLRTAGYIIGCMLVGAIVGGAVGAMRGPEVGGTFAALTSQIVGIVVSIERIRFFGKTGAPKPK